MTNTSGFNSIIVLASLSALTSNGCGGTTTGDGETTAGLTAFANDKPAYDFFVSKGLTNFQAAGIVGNLDQESGVNPGAVEYGGGPGRGIAQWSVGGRWDSGADSVVAYANAQGESSWSLDTQLAFIWYELTTYGYGFSQLRATTNVADATIVFQNEYEICGTCVQTTRINYAESVLAAYGNSAPDDCTVHGDQKLYCDDTPGAAMHADPTMGSAIVNHLQTSYSYFVCWGTGDLHDGGNTTWYYTIGDDNGNYGWVPAVDLQTSSAFDANPSAAGLPHC